MNLIAKPSKDNIKTYVPIGLFLVSLSFLDVFINAFFNFNLMGFLPSQLSFFLPLVLGFIGFYLIRIEFSGVRSLDILNKNINSNNFNAFLTLLTIFIIIKSIPPMYTATFIAENVRAGILGVGKGQKEAAASIGLNKNQILKLVVMPQALRIIIPPTTNQYLNLTKNSSLAAAIAYPDIVLVFAGTALMQTGRAIEIISITMLTYLTLSISISIFMNWYNKKMAIKEK